MEKQSITTVPSAVMSNFIGHLKSLFFYEDLVRFK
jgi:hypothetical protein